MPVHKSRIRVRCCIMVIWRETRAWLLISCERGVRQLLAGACAILVCMYMYVYPCMCVYHMCVYDVCVHVHVCMVGYDYPHVLIARRHAACFDRTPACSMF